MVELLVSSKSKLIFDPKTWKLEVTGEVEEKPRAKERPMLAEAGAEFGV